MEPQPEDQSAADAQWLESSNVVKVNQLALVTKILSRYGADFFVLKELIQNADDAGASNVVVSLSTDNTPKKKSFAAAAQGHEQKQFGHLTVTNSGGKLFDDASWARIAEIATGNPDEDSVGHFGVGFYSVFAASERPCIHSGNRSMEFFFADKQIALKKAVEPTNQDFTTVSLRLKATAEARDWNIDAL